MSFSFESKLAHSGKYRPDIDGLRAVAVVSVILFHARVSGFSGGYVGVDIFFVISGYLITSLILKDEEGRGFSFVLFYERRMRRIFPALFAVIFFCAIVASFLFTPKDLTIFGKSMVAMTLFVSNVFFARFDRSRGYFGNPSESQVLLHTWSLSVEEQFYLLFPSLLILLTRWAKRRSVVVAALLFLSGASLLLSVWATHRTPILAFYMLFPRAWELLMGALLAMSVMPVVRSRAVREILGYAGLGLVICAVLIFTDDTSFPGVSALIPCLGAWLMIYAGQDGPSSVKTALSCRPLVFLGVISYSLYLWHWPLLVFARYLSVDELGPIQKAIVLLCSVVMAFLSFEFVERPFRGSASRFSRRQIFSVGLAASTISLVIGCGIYLYKGLPGRYDASTRQLLLANADRVDDFEDACQNWKTEVHSIRDIKFCNIGPASSRKIMFWGDSHVQQLYPLIQRMYDEDELQGHGAVLAVENGCAPSENMNMVRKGYHCDSFAAFAMQRAEQQDIDTVFIGFSTWWYHTDALCPSVDGKCIGKMTPDQVCNRFLRELSAEIRELKLHGKRVIVSLPFPIFNESIPDLEARNAVFGKFGFMRNAEEVDSPRMRREVARVAQATGADVFDPRESLCKDQRCITEVNGVSIYKDAAHIAASQIGILDANLRQVLMPDRRTGAIGR